MPDPVRVTVAVNGEPALDRDVEPRLLLVHFLRDTLGLTGTHVGCDTSNCGACTVHLDGEAVKSCTVLAVQADGAEVTTIEGMGRDDDLHPLQTAFWENHGLQCGYCTPGMIMAAADLLAHNAGPLGGGDPRGARGQPLPLHGLSEHRQGRAGRGRPDARSARPSPAGGGVMSARPRPERTAPGGNGHVGRSLQAQGGPAPDHGPGHLRRRHRAARACCYAAIVRSPEAHATHRLDRHLGGQGGRGRRRRLHRRGHGRPRRAVPDGLGAAGRRGPRARPLAAGARQGRLRRPGGRRRPRPRQVRRGRRRRAGRRRVRPAARRRRPRGGARGRRADRPRGVRHQQGLRVVAARRRRRGGARRLRRRRRAARSSTTARPARRSSRAGPSPSGARAS